MRKLFNALLLFILCSINLVSAKIQLNPSIPNTGMEISEPGTELDVPSFSSFLKDVHTGAVDRITGIYIPDILAFPVIQQPTGHPEYVSPVDDEVTQFGMAADYGSLGFLAHNTLAGIEFSNITPEMLIFVVSGNGHFSIYQVQEIRRFQAYSPSSPYSSFYDLSTGDILSATDLFMQTYMIEDAVILQTCIASGGIDSWGRLFIVATPFMLESPPQ